MRVYDSPAVGLPPPGDIVTKGAGRSGERKREGEIEGGSGERERERGRERKREEKREGGGLEE